MKSCYWTLVLLLYLPFTQSACSFTQVVKTVSSTKFSISWNLPDSCIRRVDEYIVRYNHLGWQACYDESPSTLSVSTFKPEDPIKEIKLDKQTVSYELEDLFPYSKYNISIEAIDNGKLYGKTILATYQTEFLTDSSKPNTKPSSYEASRLVKKEHIIIFQWKEPEPEQCTNQNGKLDGYYVELRGVDPWARGVNGQVIRNESVQALSYTAFELLSYTTYELWVYTKNLHVSEMSNKKLVIQGKTLASKPGVPENVTAQTVSNSSIHLSWYPAYPRTGEIDHYEVKRGVQSQDNKVVYTERYSVESSHESACGDTRLKSNSSVKICYAFDDLQPGQTYYFQVQTINKIGLNDTLASDLSEQVTATTFGAVTTEAPATSGLIISTEVPNTPVPPTEGDSFTSLVIGIVALVFVLILGIVFIVFRYRWKLKALKERLRLEESINKNRMDQNFTMSMSTLDTSFRPGQFDTSTITRLDYSTRTESGYMDETMLSKDGPVYTNTSTIQSRRLPVPPPLSVTGPPQPGLLPSPHIHSLPGSQQQPVDSHHHLPSSPNQLGLPTEYNQPRGSPRGVVVGEGVGPQITNTVQQHSYDTPRSLNVSPIAQGYLDMSLKRRKAQKKLLEDTEGYMEPRFHSSQLSRTDEVMSDEESGVSPIPAASYGTTVDQSSDHEERGRKEFKVRVANETDQSKVNLLQYERPDLLSTVKPEQTSQDSDQSDGSNHFLLSSSQIV